MGHPGGMGGAGNSGRHCHPPITQTSAEERKGLARHDGNDADEDDINIKNPKLLYHIFLTCQFQFWPPGGVTCVGSKFGHQMAPLALFRNMAAR